MAAKYLGCSPKRRLLFEKLSGKRGEEKCLKSVLDHHFNFSVGLLVPTFSKHKLCQNISSSPSLFNEFSCLTDMPLTEFIDIEFIQRFVEKGSVLALSHGTRIDTSDCVALLPTGILHLSLTKDTYECLGLQGKLSPFNDSLRFDVKINLLAPYFKPNKKYYERVKRSFQRLAMKFKFLVSSICSQGTKSSACGLGTYLQSHNIVYQEFFCQVQFEDFSNIDIPCVSYNNHFSEDEPRLDSECSDGLSFHEWLGSVTCGIDCSVAAPGNFVNTLCCPTPCQKTNLAFCKWTGFLTSESIQDVVKKARKLLTEHPEIPWLSVLVWGFSDCPVSWRDRRHGYYISGDNHYTIVMFPCDGETWMYRTLGDNDEQP